MSAAQIVKFILVDSIPLLLTIVALAFVIHHQKEYAKDPFVCPHCGSEFYVKWWQLFLGRYFSLVLTDKAVLKCPHCGQKDRCRWTGKER